MTPQHRQSAKFAMKVVVTRDAVVPSVIKPRWFSTEPSGGTIEIFASISRRFFCANNQTFPQPNTSKEPIRRPQNSTKPATFRSARSLVTRNLLGWHVFGSTAVNNPQAKPYAEATKGSATTFPGFSPLACRTAFAASTASGVMPNHFSASIPRTSSR